MIATFVLLDAVLPLSYLRFRDALLPWAGSWMVLPSLWVFPGWALSVPVPGLHVPPAQLYDFTLGWQETGLLFSAFLLLFLVYVLALRYLPRRVSQRFIFLSTLLLGLFCVCIPVVTSSDIFSYIAYARLGVIYHLNPLTALPIWIRHDPIYPHVDWVRQPSAYGPMWAVIICLLQMLVGAQSSAGIMSMVLALRLFGLAMHLGSVMLIWSISGYLVGFNATYTRERRLLLTLAFAWNPLLLVEACVNAHNDVTLLFFVLLMLWLLARSKVLSTQTIMLAAILFAVVTCLKINIVVLLPGLLLFLWMQPRRWNKILDASLAYLGTVALLYLPFWQNGAVLDVFRVNPATYRATNSLAEFAARIYNGLVLLPGQMVAPAINSPAERFTHTVSLVVFVGIFVAFCGWTIFQWRYMRTVPGLIRWLALSWLLYCVIGAPWFWPWYLVTFFGLSTLVEATAGSEGWSIGFLRVSPFTLLLTFSMLSLYAFSSWPMSNGNVPGLIAFDWAYFRGLWIWLLPLLALPFLLKKRRKLLKLQPQARIMAPSEKVRTFV
jgi:hypothetical protein